MIEETRPSLARSSGGGGGAVGGGGLRGWFSSAKETFKHVLHTGEFSRPPPREAPPQLHHQSEPHTSVASGPTHAAQPAAAAVSARPSVHAGAVSKRDEVMLVGVQMTD